MPLANCFCVLSVMNSTAKSRKIIHIRFRFIIFCKMTSDDVRLVTVKNMGFFFVTRFGLAFVRLMICGLKKMKTKIDAGNGITAVHPM